MSDQETWINTPPPNAHADAVARHRLIQSVKAGLGFAWDSIDPFVQKADAALITEATDAFEKLVADDPGNY